MVMTIREKDLFDNPTARVPVCLLLDNSWSMSGDPIDELNRGVRLFYEALLKDEVTKYSVEIAVVSFGGDVKVELDFEAIERQKIPVLGTYGMTPMGEAVEKALSLLSKRKIEYQDAGVDYYQPWMVLMTDGSPTDIISHAVCSVREQVNKNKLLSLTIGIGNEADMNKLGEFSPKQKPLKLQGLRFEKFFRWLSRSVAAVSQSMPGEKIEIDYEGMKDWSNLD